MSSDNTHPPSSSSETPEFRVVDRISSKDKPLSGIVSSILQHEEAGIPIVVCGLNADPNWFPLLGSDPLEQHGPARQPHIDHPEHQGTPPSKDPFVWINQLSSIPEDLLPPGPRETSFVTVDHREESERKAGQLLEQNHCASTLHWLTLDCTGVDSDVWFILEASYANQMEAHLSDESRKVSTSSSELLSCPFPVFRHVQSAGDLLIIPPRCYAQNFREGSSTSISWSRVSIHGLILAWHSELPMYRRLCRTEAYNIRKVIYTTMKSHASKIKGLLSGSPTRLSDPHPDEHSPILRMADRLRKLILLFDHILLEGYCDDHDSIFLPEHMPRDPTCHYCGASLFLSYFSCAGMCFDLETDSPRFDMSIRICGACYVEGRSCACMNMTPRRLRDFSDILRERNDAASTLSNLASCLASVDDLSETSEKDFSWPRIAIFQAAKELWKLRHATAIERRGRTCTPRGGERSHAMPPYALINCRKCHAAKCFRHILKGGVHSSEALLAVAADPSGIVWHQLHHAARQRDAPSHWTQGRLVGLAERLLFFASNFSGTSPVNGETSVGFYDGHDSETLAGLESTREEGNNSDMSFQAFSSTPATNSRASSRSTTVPPSDEETQGHPANVGDAGFHSTRYGDVSAATSRSRSKRPRNTESQDEAEYPSKRIRLRRSSAKTLRASSSQSTIIAPEVATQDPPQLQRPGTLQSGGVRDPMQMLEPAEKRAANTSAISQTTLRRRSTTIEQDHQPTASTSKVDQIATLQRKSARAGSSSSFGPNLASTPGVDQPLAFNFFNPAIDLQRPESPVLPFRTLGIEPEPETLTPATQPLRRLGSLFRRGFSLSSPTLHPLASSPLPQTHFSATEVGGPSPFARGVGTSRHLAPEDIAQELRRRRDSHEDLDAQRALGVMQGDSLLKENVQGYIELLRASGAFGNLS